MMARSEYQYDDRPAGLQNAALSVLLGVVAAVALSWAIGIVNRLPATNTSWVEPLGTAVVNLIIGAGAIWGLLRLKPSSTKSGVLTLLLGYLALDGFANAAGILAGLLHLKIFWEPGVWHTLWILAVNLRQTLCILAVDLLIGVGAIWGLLKLKPWRSSDEPVSPATRRTNKLFGLSGVVTTVGALVLLFGTFDKDNPFGLFSNSPVSLGIAAFAITTWLVGQAINKWWWYFSADEHERKADDFGNLVGWALFMIATPVWWVAARAGVLPQPDPMVLWAIAVGASAIGWFWHRNR